MEVYSVKPKKLAKLQKEFGKLPSNGMKHEKKKKHRIGETWPYCLTEFTSENFLVKMLNLFNFIHLYSIHKREMMA